MVKLTEQEKNVPISFLLWFGIRPFFPHLTLQSLLPLCPEDLARKITLTRFKRKSESPLYFLHQTNGVNINSKSLNFIKNTEALF